ncbi:protein CUSTOS [Discoglossus pictus]
MAASRGPVGDSDSDSSEDQERFREAAWEPPSQARGAAKILKTDVPSTLPSSRVRPDCHEHDGNELQTTPEFRSHVAKKLAAILDSCIKESSGGNSLQRQPVIAPDTEDEGFRLFCTSVPGDTGTVTKPPCSRRKVESSCSEDSEEETLRFREAAVSAADILKHSALHCPQKEHCENAPDDQPPKKKKKKKKKKKEGGEGDCEIGPNEDNEHSQPGENRLSEKRKKKKKQSVDLGPFVAGDEGQDDEMLHPGENGLSEKRKKKKKQSVDLGPCVGGDEGQDDEMLHPGKNGLIEKRKKKKKRKVDVLLSEED